MKTANNGTKDIRQSKIKSEHYKKTICLNVIESNSYEEKQLIR